MPAQGKRPVGGTPESIVSTEPMQEFILQGGGGQCLPADGKKRAFCRLKPELGALCYTSSAWQPFPEENVP